MWLYEYEKTDLFIMKKEKYFEIASLHAKSKRKFEKTIKILALVRDLSWCTVFTT